MKPERPERIEIRASKDELRRWRKLAQQAGETFAAWWRSLARAAEAKHKREMDER